MEAKASRISQRSNAGQAKVGKILSKASLTPSQMSERTRLNAAANKDPLDALSRMGTRQPTSDRRSGLQDVDDDYLKTVVYSFAKQTGQTAADRAKVTADMMPAGVPTMRGGRAPAGNDSTGVAAAVQDPVQAQTGQVQQQVPIVQAQQNHPPQQVQSQQSQLPQQMQAQSTPQAPASPQDMSSVGKPQESAPPAQQGGAAHPRQGGGGEPELYTTCPNCRATLYLVRNAGEASPYNANQQGDSAQGQQQQ